MYTTSFGYTCNNTKKKYSISMIAGWISRLYQPVFGCFLTSLSASGSVVESVNTLLRKQNMYLIALKKQFDQKFAPSLTEKKDRRTNLQPVPHANRRYRYSCGRKTSVNINQIVASLPHLRDLAIVIV